MNKYVTCAANCNIYFPSDGWTVNSLVKGMSMCNLRHNLSLRVIAVV